MGFALAVQPVNLITTLIGTVLGIVFGALPGLSGTMGIAILLPITYGMDPTPALLLMVSIFCGSLYGGSITAILLSTPGTPGAAATIFDGYPMTKQGRANEALMEAAIASFWGGVFSLVALFTMAPAIAKFSLKFGPIENFMIAIFGLTIIASLSSKNMLKGLISGLIGLLASTVGMDSFVGYARYTFKIAYLQTGLSMIVVMIGLFSISQVLQLVSSSNNAIVDDELIKNLKPAKFTPKDIFRYPLTYIRSSIIGIIVGIIPGAGGSIAAFISYNEARRASKHPELFGTGIREGIAATECSNNTVTGGALIPMLTLGIPGSTACAVMLGGMMVHGLLPGNDLFTVQAKVIYPVMAGMFFANLFFMIIGISCAKYFAFIARVPIYLLAPVIVVLCTIGSFAISNNMVDVYVMILFGLIGYFLIKFEFDITPVVLGLILGRIAEGGLGRAIMINKGSAAGTVRDLLSSPICIVLLVVSIVSLFAPLYREYKEKKKAKAE
ncbi:MAG: tripartite tricarboxylate transporter permease [Stomatobaculum sp.]|nr:tripartite tricarboxylate transporter permease [Stomatobaculum sp.]